MNKLSPIKNKMAPSNQSQLTITAHQIHKKMQNGPFLKFPKENTAGDTATAELVNLVNYSQDS